VARIVGAGQGPSSQSIPWIENRLAGQGYVWGYEQVFLKPIDNKIS
jgi:hypothetical protein